MQYHSLFEPYQLPHGEWTSLHLTWLRTPIARSSKYTPWRLICSHHIHDGGLRAQYNAYGEYRLSQESHHIHSLNSNRFTCSAPPCSCHTASGVHEGGWEGDFRASEDPWQQWGDVGPASRRRDRKRPVHSTRSCCNKPSLNFDAPIHSHETPPPRNEHTRGQPGWRVPPHPPSQRPTLQQLEEAWVTYQYRCRTMSDVARVATVKRRYLSFSSIPWPVFGSVTHLSDLSLPAIQSFLCAPGCSHSEQRARVKEALLFFHPDKSTSRWGGCLRPEDVPVVKEALNIVTRHLTTILHSF